MLALHWPLLLYIIGSLMSFLCLKPILGVAPPRPLSFLWIFSLLFKDLNFVLLFKYAH